MLPERIDEVSGGDAIFKQAREGSDQSMSFQDVVEPS